MSASPLLEIEDLAVAFDTEDGTLRAVDGVSLTVREGEAAAVVGESGSGKSVTALAVMGLLAAPPARVERGRIRYRGTELLDLDPKRRRALGGRELSMIYQDSMASLNPSMTVGRQIAQVVRNHRGGSRTAALSRAAELLELVGIPDPRARLGSYPHQLSGGQRQRVLIGLALACEPRLLIADEPTTALDVTVQAQIIELVARLRAELGMAVMWITHDLGVVAGLVDSVAVMYAGRIVERAPVRALFAQPRHPYTAGLLRSLPGLDGPRRRLVPIPGGLPDLTRPIEHCAFAPRCEHAVPECLHSVPELLPVREAHEAACLRTDEVAAGAGRTPPAPAAAEGDGQ
ncbi:oligopeptide/dipeptide ABC transporter ATP-binding protein [Spinactinospora alkalitolerans]|uniref:Oligopeptide/dipeptide ABC transporter ATP-binding protein n=1 Tax=Spinactinospora alkalitolerans TaxID=687207 RepID=A0A852U1R3_9ACTN|nr:ABC transporter ATP-binding protein [Spinactinospora alkalitolerans]NYE48104.1 oligopeptide/dipeptide ABC transporter ATP-binding protein [Spinactinospora alkalitolerans]